MAYIQKEPSPTGAPQPTSPAAASKKRRLVVLGGGFGSFRLARGVTAKRYDLTVVSPRNHFLFTPLLASTTVGTVEFRSIIEPLRFAQPGLRYFQATCTGINAERKTIRCEPQGEEAFDLPYDILVIGVGTTTSTFGVPGVTDHAVFLKQLSDARLIRRRIVDALERASLPHTTEEERKRLLHFVIVGGGPTGVEFAAELHDFVDRDLRRAFSSIADLLQITILEAGSSLLSTFDRDLSQYTMRFFRARKIEVRTDSIVKEVRAQEVILKDGSIVPFGVLVWAAGVAPVELTAGLPFAKGKNGRILTDSFLRVLDHPDIYAIGDCALVQGSDLPMTGQVAQQQGKYLAKALNLSARGAVTRPFHFTDLGMLAYIGENRAVADLPGVSWRGFFAWLLWRSVYITKLVGLRNKARVLFDWARTRIFGRDVSSF